MSFIKTFSGKHFYYDRINKDDIVINDIAVSLSNICRFAGHLSHFYSVAQHAVLCSQLVPQEFAFEALMHDATEAYCQDIPAPLKRLLGNDSNLLIVFYVQIMPDDFVMQLHRF